MKAALITEEQIKAIEAALNDSEPFNFDLYRNALAIVKSLKVQEPVGYKLKKPYSDIFTDRQVEDYEMVNWTPLYAQEKAE